MQNQMIDLMGNKNLIQQYIQFRDNFTGNPQAEVMKLVSQGKINQAQLNKLQSMAQEFQTLLNNVK